MRLIDADLLIEEYKTSAENTFNRPIKFKNSLIYKQIKKAPTVNAIPISVIEDIKTEIQKALDEDKATDTENAKVQAIALMWCLEVIDKYGKEQE